MLQFLPVGFAFAADRYTYVPSVGLFFLAGEGFSSLYKSQLFIRKPQGTALLLTASLAILLLACLSWQRCYVWRDGVTLWTDELNKYPNLARAYHNRGQAYLSRKEFQHARNDLLRAIDLEPSFPEAHSNLCEVYLLTGEPEKAVPECSKSIRLNPSRSVPYNLLGRIYVTQDKDTAIAMFRKALLLNPRYAEAQLNLCTTLVATGNRKDSVSACSRAVAIGPNADSYNNLGNAYLLAKDLNAAVDAYNKALSADPGYALAHANLAVVYYYAGLCEMAISHSERAQKLGHPVHPDLLKALSKTCGKESAQGSTENAVPPIEPPPLN